MADYLAAKGPTETVERLWTPATDDTIATIATTASGVTVASAAKDGDAIKFVLSGGTAGQTGVVTVTVTTEVGETLVDTLYVPVIASAAQVADTAREYVHFALRPVTGAGEVSDDSELDDALEILNALVAEMRAGGADIASPYPLVASSVIYCPDWAVSALRHNLRVQLLPTYGQEPSAMDYERARRGMQLVKHKNLPEVRESEYF
jgi:hypothetical protein